MRRERLVRWRGPGSGIRLKMTVMIWEESPRFDEKVREVSTSWRRTQVHGISMVKRSEDWVLLNEQVEQGGLEFMREFT